MAMLPRFEVVGSLGWLKGPIEECIDAAHHFLGEASTGSVGADVGQRVSLGMHQTAGALQMVGLDGAGRFANEIERFLGKVAAVDAARAPEAIGTAQAALTTLSNYLTDVIGGQPDTPAPLFPLFEKLAQANGAESVGMSDLFFPALEALPPAHPEPVSVAAAELGALVKAQRSRFQRALLNWLRGEPGATNEMSGALLEVERTQGEPHRRVFWWIAGGLVDCVKSNREAPPAELKKLFSRIDRQFARLASGEPHVAEQLLRDMLYWISRAETDLPRPREIQRHYDLAQSGPAAAQSQSVSHTINQVRAAVDATHAVWVKYIADGHDVAAMRDRLCALPEIVAPLHNDALNGLSSALGKAGASLTQRIHADPELANEVGVALDVASSLLASLGAPAQRLLDLAGVTSQNLAHQLARPERRDVPVPPKDQQAATGISVDEVRLLDEQGNAQPEQVLTETLAREMVANLNRAEELLEQFFRSESNHGVLGEVERLMAQIHGGLQMTELQQALELLERCRDLVGHCKRVGRAAPEEIEALAGALSSLGDVLKAAETGEIPAAAITSVQDATLQANASKMLTVESQLDTKVQRSQDLVQSWGETPQTPEVRSELQGMLEKVRDDAQLVANSPLEEQASRTLVMLAFSQEAPSAELVEAVMTMNLRTAAANVTAASGNTLPHSDDDAIDHEMLEVFLEEAREVVADCRSHWAALRAVPTNQSALREIRRGFHTLKGSSRMVGLKEYGEVAWTAEQALNHWLDRNSQASDELYAFIEQAARHFGAWVEDIATGSKPEIDPQTLSAAALKLEQTVVVPSDVMGAASDESKRDDEAVTSSKTTEIHRAPSHTQPVSVTLREIYLGESAQLLTVLGDEIEAWALQRACAPAPELVRAVHTLAGISRTTTQPATAALAYAVEKWAVHATEHPHDPGESAVHLIRRAHQQLRSFVDAFRNCTPVKDEPLLVDEIEALCSELPVAAAVAQPAPKEVEGTRSLGITAVAEERRKVVDDIDLDLLPVFLEEAESLVPAVGGSLRDWYAQPADTNSVQALQRSLHTFKGSARMVGALRLGELIHRIESEVNEIIDTGSLAEQAYEALQAKIDRVNDAVERLRAGDFSAVALEQTTMLARLPIIERDATMRLLTTLEQQATQRLSLSQRMPAEVTALLAPSAESNTQSALGPDASASAQRGFESVPLEAAQPRSLIRVAAESVDNMVNHAGEVNIARSRVESEVRFLRNSFNELTQNIIRLRQQLREVEIQAEGQLQSRQQQALADEAAFDPLEFDRFTRLQELTRMMAESVNDIGVVQHAALKNLDEADAALRSQARTSFDLQQQLMRVRMVPFANVADRFYRIVRVTARELGKRAQLELHGAKVELDRGVLEHITAPLEHLLRNALAHGIEAVSEREGAGKPAEGRIQLELEQQGNDVVITLSDDGRGINVDDVQRTAIARGLLAADHNFSRRQLIEHIFMSGFSTAAEVTEVAGRGVGLDVVKNEISALGGRVEVSSEFGKCTRFVIYLPLTLAVAEALLVRVGKRKYALPSAIVQQVQRFTPEAIAVVQSIRELSWAGEGYRFSYMLELFGEREVQAESKRFSHVLLLRSGGQRLAVQVDELIGIRQVVVKAIGPQLATVSGLVGATVLADGEIVLIVNPVTLAQTNAASDDEPNSTQRRNPIGSGSLSASKRGSQTIMVVDDSITVRKISERTLSREGYQVVLAKDGLDALEKLRDAVPDVMLVDIEMPRMDGFDLTRNVRGDAKTRHVPIIMITSRTAEKHRNHALQLGVDVYLGKPYSDEDLLRHIKSLLAPTRAAGEGSSVKWQRTAIQH